MRIDWKQQIEGYPLLQIRNALRKLHFTNTPFNSTFFAEHLTGGNRVKAELVLDGLIRSKLAIHDQEYSGSYKLTDSGISLRAANATKRFKRERADRAVSKLLEIARTINADPIFLHDVEAIAIFGSYLTDQPDLGDVDAAYKLKGRWLMDPELPGRETTDLATRKERFERVYPPPDSFYDKWFWRLWPETYTKRLLRTDPGIKLIELCELELIGCPYRQIFPEVKDFPAKPGWSFQREEIVIAKPRPQRTPAKKSPILPEPCRTALSEGEPRTTSEYLRINARRIREGKEPI